MKADTVNTTDCRIKQVICPNGTCLDCTDNHYNLIPVIVRVNALIAPRTKHFRPILYFVHRNILWCTRNTKTHNEN